jgi:hypothetical protein
MNGWLIAAWLLLIFIGVTVWHNISWARMQRRAALQRNGLTSTEYEEEFRQSRVRPEIASALYASLSLSIAKGILPHPDDGLLGFYFDDPECVGDLVEEMFEKLGLELPNPQNPENIEWINSARDLGVYLEQKLANASLDTPVVNQE